MIFPGAEIAKVYKYINIFLLLDRFNNPNTFVNTYVDLYAYNVCLAVILTRSQIEDNIISSFWKETEAWEGTGIFSRLPCDIEVSECMLPA